MSIDETARKNFGWVLLELMGHRQRIGKAAEEEVAGGIMLRIDVPVNGDAEYVTEFYGASSIYAMRPISEDVAKGHFARSDPRPPRPADYRPAAQIGYSDDDDNCDDDVADY